MDIMKIVNKMFQRGDIEKITIKITSRAGIKREVNILYSDKYDNIICDICISESELSWTLNEYDDHNNQTSSRSSNGGEITCVYDYNERDQLVQSKFFTNTKVECTVYTYDAKGRLICEEDPITKEATKTINYRNDKISSVVTPDETQKYKYDKDGRIKEISGINVVKYYHDDPSFPNRITAYSVNGKKTEVTYDTDGEITQEKNDDMLTQFYYIYPNAESTVSTKAENQKYVLTEDTMEYDGHTLHRIRALRDLSRGVIKGELGGWVESEQNLSHEGDCWVSENAKVYDNAGIKDNAYVAGKAIINENAKVYDNAEVSGSVFISGQCIVHDNSRIKDFAMILDNTEIGKYALISGRAEISENAKITGHAEISENAEVSGNSNISGHARVYGEAVVTGDSNIGKNVNISGTAYLKDVQDHGSTYYYGDICD